MPVPSSFSLSAPTKVEDLNRWEARAVYFERLIFFTIFATWQLY